MSVRPASLRTQYTPSVHSVGTFVLEAPFSSTCTAKPATPAFYNRDDVIETPGLNDPPDAEERELKNTIARVIETQGDCCMHSMARDQSSFRTRIAFMHLLSGCIPGRLVGPEGTDDEGTRSISNSYSTSTHDGDRDRSSGEPDTLFFLRDPRPMTSWSQPRPMPDWSQ